jgi:hypothetical protein
MDSLELLAKLHQTVDDFLSEHAYHLREAKDESGEFSYLNLSSDDMKYAGGARIGRYLETGWTFIDFPFQNRVMLKHIMYGESLKPDQQLLERAKDLASGLGVSAKPALRA